MTRNRFRSQPTLQRTGSRSSIWPWALVAAVIGVSAVIGVQLGRMTPPPATPKAASSPAAPSAPAPMAMADAPAVVPQAPGPQAQQPAPAAREPGPPLIKAPPPRRKAPPTAEAAAPEAAPQALTYEERREAYQVALARYDRSERAAGYRWAKDNSVGRARNCRDESRTPAFMAGCLDYVHKAPLNMGDAAQDAASREPDAAGLPPS